MIRGAIRNFIRLVVGGAFSLLGWEIARFYYSAYLHQDLPAIMNWAVPIGSFMFGIILMGMYDAMSRFSRNH